MKTSSWPSFHSPISGSSTAERISAMSAMPYTRRPAAPPAATASATARMVAGEFIGSPGYA